MMKKLMISLLSLLVCLGMYMAPLHAESEKEETAEGGETAVELAKNAKAAYLMEYSSGKVVYARNETEKLYPASMTKMMGLLLIYESLNNGKITWDDVVTASEHASSMGGSQIFLEPNETMTVRDLVKAISIASANDAMVAMAEKVGGTHEGFVDMMNKKAKELGLENTHFVNATGLHDPEHYSCAKDMGIIAQELIRVGDQDLLDITGTYDAYIREDSDQKFWLVNTNKLLKQYEGVDGLKTGFTQEAMSCITVTAKRDNLRLIAVVMGEPSSKVRNEEIKQMLDYGYSIYAQDTLMPAGTVLEERLFENGKPNKANLVTTEDLMYVYEKGKQTTESSRDIVITKKELPYTAGEVIGTVTITMSDGFVITSDITVDTDIQPLEYLDIFMKAFQDFFL